MPAGLKDFSVKNSLSLSTQVSVFKNKKLYLHCLGNLYTGLTFFKSGSSSISNFIFLNVSLNSVDCKSLYASPKVV